MPRPNAAAANAGVRYRLYALDDAGEPILVAEAETPEGLGLALVTIARERRDAGLRPQLVGAYDAEEGLWLTTLWRGGAR